MQHESKLTRKTNIFSKPTDYVRLAKFECDICFMIANYSIYEILCNGNYIGKRVAEQ